MGVLSLLESSDYFRLPVASDLDTGAGVVRGASARDYHVKVPPPKHRVWRSRVLGMEFSTRVLDPRG